jgi:DNA-directed RNA polymerase subunit RPC12/RpoP
MKPKQLRIIKCPKCGMEYLPAEIYYPNVFLGTPLNVMRSIEGKILGFDGTSMNDTETYKCDNCDSLFEVVSTTNFTSKLVGESSEDHITKLSTKKLFLQES